MQLIGVTLAAHWGFRNSSLGLPCSSLGLPPQLTGVTPAAHCCYPHSSLELPPQLSGVTPTAHWSYSHSSLELPHNSSITLKQLQCLARVLPCEFLKRRASFVFFLKKLLCSLLVLPWSALPYCLSWLKLGPVLYEFPD